jgi:hypothetical protein
VQKFCEYVRYTSNAKIDAGFKISTEDDGEEDDVRILVKNMNFRSEITLEMKFVYFCPYDAD